MIRVFGRYKERDKNEIYPTNKMKTHKDWVREGSKTISLSDTMLTWQQK